MRAEDWQNSAMRCFGMLMDGRAQPTGLRQRGEDQTVLLVLNAHSGLVDFTLPEAACGDRWSLVLDTSIVVAVDAQPAEAAFPTGSAYGVTGRSLLLFSLMLDPART